MRRRRLASVLVASALTVPSLAHAAPPVQQEAAQFLDLYNSLYRVMTTVVQEAEWAGSTDVSDRSDGRRTAADQVFAAFRGDKKIIATTQALLAKKADLLPIQVRQLDRILLAAAAQPGTIPAVVSARIEAESRQASIQDGFQYCLQPRAKDGTCAKPAIANDLDEKLRSSKDMAERLHVWETAKEIGRPLKPGLAELQKLRNQVAREMGYSSFFALQVADYGMTVAEMMKLLDGFVTDSTPLYKSLHTWTRKELAKRYGQKVPEGDIPAHWLTNRWAQNWVGLAPGVDLDPYFKDKKPEWIVKQAESFYTSMGMQPLPASFWKKSDLYPVPKGDARKKNSHASAWHMDLDQDVRSLMSVEPDSQWFSTAHHELGHIYYYLAYSRPEVPPLLREGANRAFHEGIGELISIASTQVPYLQQQGILPKDAKVDPTQWLLNEALEHTVAFIPFSAGTMSRFEYELYEHDLPPAKWQQTWWDLVQKYQHVAPPSPTRLTDPTACDACTKTHINDDPGQYYDYAIATVLKYQLHEHIARKILHQDPHSCNYYGNKEVGAFLQKILAQGATRDWRLVLKEATGEDLSTRAMVEYFKPLQTWLDAENAKP
jgi:peptidyl-dipeptidase A